jgi:ribose-phosphate pyrophosphokinase
MPLKIIKGRTNRSYLEYKRFVFSGGEVSVKLNAENHAFLADPHADTITMVSRMAVDALRRSLKREHRIELFLPYIPYARQDRACVKGESFSLKVFANLLNSLNFDPVIVLDPHSHVAEACIDRIKVVSQQEIIGKYQTFKERVLKGVTFVSPDAGANKKTAELAHYFQHKEFIRADKLRDLENGKILETIVYADDLKGQDIVIADDICDGGRTFIELAKVLKTKGASKVILYVTHGIFSQGIKPLYEGGIDEIWTTTSFSDDFEGAFGKDFHSLPVESLI